MSTSARLLPGLLFLCLGVSGCAGSKPAGLTPDAAEWATERQIIVAVHDKAPRRHARAGAISRAYGGNARYRGSPTARRQMANLAKLHGLRKVASWPIGLLDLYCVVFEVPPGRMPEELLVEIAEDPDVALVQPMHSFTLLSTAATTETPASSPSTLAGVGIRHAHQWATGRGVKVALIDTGIDSGHPGLKGRVLLELDLVGSRAFVSVDEPHGLAVAGVIAARAGFDAEIVGVAPEASLLALRACWQIGHEPAVCNSLTLARAIAAAVAHGAAVINLSLSGPPDPLLERLLRRAMQRNLVVVGAVPEDSPAAGVDVVAARFPTSVPGVIPVRTAELDGGGNPDALPAPGENVLTLFSGGGSGLASGSSLAAAHVSGVVALLLEQRSELGPGEVRALLDEFIRPLAVDGQGPIDVVSGCLAVAALVNGYCPGTAARTAGAAAPAGRSPSTSIVDQ